MNSYLHIPFSVIHENYYINKILLHKKFKTFFANFRNNFLNLLLINYFLMWKNVFKPNFWINRKNKQSYKSALAYDSTFFFKKQTIRFNMLLNLIKNNFVIFIFFNNFKNTTSLWLSNIFKANSDINAISIYFLNIYKRTFGEGFFYIRGLAIIFFIDACITDDEPLWEPIEWSLVQTWILFIFIFAWIAENLITSRYGSYTGRDKRVWFAWYKTFWLLDLCYILSYGVTAVFIIVPFYYELTYSVSFIFSWWNWYTRVFFFKFISIYTIVLFFAHLLQLNVRWLNWKKLFFFVLIINVFIAYLLYTHFIMTFFGYFTDPVWYQKTRFIDYIQLSHEPLKWGWGPAKRDHFTYHKVSTTFWFKNDGPFAGAFLMIHLFFFITLFFLYIYWVVLLRRVYTTKEITYTFTTFCVSALKQFYYFFFLIYILIFMSFLVCYWRFPIEFLWMINSNSWILNFLMIIGDYFLFLINIF